MAIARSEWMSLEWTSVPRWPSPELPPAASYLACWFGDEAGRQARALLAGADPGVPVRTAAFADRWDDATETELRRLIGELGASDQELVPVAIEATRTSDTTDAEITARGAERSTPAEAETGGYIVGTAGRRVFCAGCRSSFDAVAAIRGTVACPGCAAELIVDYRFSRPHAAYFGWPTGLDLHR
jgi:hypothetical protein